jgi:ectoine hydroxylase-related dioxygenase (phytanoyl-CoA dioxygenase family)
MKVKNYDISFSSNSQLNKLFSFYEKNGYVKLGKIVSDAYIKKLVKVTNDLMQGKRSYPGMFFKLDDPKGNYFDIKHEDIKNEKFSGPSNRYKKIKDLEYVPELLNCIKLKILKKFSQKYIGSEVSSMRAMILNKSCINSSILPFHQDVSNKWKMSKKPSFTLWMSLNGATKKNGCLKVIEGSHKYGILNYGNNLSALVEKKLKKKHKVVFLELKPGEAVLFSNYTVHGSNKNKTKKNRLGFTVCLMDARTKNLKTNKNYPKIFGRNSLSLSRVLQLKKIPKQVYLK